MNVSPVLLKRIQQGIRFGGGKPGPQLGWNELTLEERIASLIAEARTIGVNKSTYKSTREKLKDSRTKTERRLTRSKYEKEKAAEKVATIEAKMQAEIRVVEDSLDGKLRETQARIDQEVHACPHESLIV